MSSEHHPADARRRAEEWLTRYDSAVPSIPPGSADPPEVRLLRSLLAAITAEGEAKHSARWPVADLADARRRAEEALAGVERERLVSHIREAAKFATRADRMVFLHDYEAKALVVVIDALRALLAALPGEGAEGPLPEYGPCPYYRNGEPHSNCEVCGGLGALPILPADILAPQLPEQPAPVIPAYKLPPEVEAALAPIRGLRITADEIKAALKSVMPYGPGQRDEAFVQVAAEAAASSRAALSSARGAKGGAS